MRYLQVLCMVFAVSVRAEEIELAPPLLLEHLGLSLRLPARGEFEACAGKRILRHAYAEKGAPVRTVELFILAATREDGTPIPIQDCLKAAVKEIADGHAKAKNELRELESAPVAVAGRGGLRTLFEVRREGTRRGAGAAIVWPLEFPRDKAPPRPFYCVALVRGTDAPDAIKALCARMLPTVALTAPKSPAEAALPPLRIVKEYKDHGMTLGLPLGWTVKERPPTDREILFELTAAGYDYAELAAPQVFRVEIRGLSGPEDIFASPELLDPFVRALVTTTGVQGKTLKSHRVIELAGKSCLEAVILPPQDSRERLEVRRLLRANGRQYQLSLVALSPDLDAARAKLDAFTQGFRLLPQ